MGVADYIVSQRGEGEEAENTRATHRVPMVLNAAWSVLFFGLRAPLAALVEIVFLCVSRDRADNP